MRAAAAIPDRTTKEKFQEFEVGIDLHRVIAEISGNAMLCGILDKCQHYVWTELLWLDEWKIAREEHAEIVEAICAATPPAPAPWPAPMCAARAKTC